MDLSTKSTSPGRNSSRSSSRSSRPGSVGRSGERNVSRSSSRGSRGGSRGSRANSRGSRADSRSSRGSRRGSFSSRDGSLGSREGSTGNQGGSKGIPRGRGVTRGRLLCLRGRGGGNRGRPISTQGYGNIKNFRNTTQSFYLTLCFTYICACFFQSKISNNTLILISGWCHLTFKLR